MSFDMQAFQGDFNLRDLHETNKFYREFNAAHPNYFKPDGLILFCGGQGAGKTLSAVRYIYRILHKYPNCVVYSNIKLNIPVCRDLDPDWKVDYKAYKSISDVANCNNGYDGILLFLDEIQVEFSSLESAKIHPSVIQTISQQRKRRLHVVGTTQLFKRLAKPWREQCNAIVDCSALLGGRIQRNSLVDLGSIAEDANGNLTNYNYSNHAYWFRAKRYFDMYDTSERVNRVGGGM